MKTVLANGVFDVLHIGHLYHLEAARTFGDRLVVAVTCDAFVNKGSGRPVFKDVDRLRMVRALRCVDEAVLVSTSITALESIRPDVFVKGAEYRDKILAEDREFCEKNGIEIAFTDEPTYSSTALLSYKLRPAPQRYDMYATPGYFASPPPYIETNPSASGEWVRWSDIAEHYDRLRENQTA